MVFEVIGEVLSNNALFGGGMFLGILGIILGTTRGLVSQMRYFTILFSSLCWVFSIVLFPNFLESGLLFLTGAIGFISAFSETLGSYAELDIFKLSLMAFSLNLVLTVGFMFFEAGIGYPTSLEETDAVNLIINSGLEGVEKSLEEHKLENGDISSGSYDSLSFDLVSSALNILGWLLIAVKFIAITALLPLMITWKLSPLLGGFNEVLAWIIGLVLNGYNLIVIYHTIMFVLNKRGKGIGSNDKK